MQFQKTNNLQYTNLNAKTTYSFLKSLIKVDDLINFALQNNQHYVSIMDENVLYGAMGFYLECLKNNLKPVIGFELRTQQYHALLIALNYRGYLNIVKICSFVNLKKEFELTKYLQDVAVVDFFNNIEQVHDDFYSVNENEPNYIALQTANYLNPKDYSAYLLINAIKNDQTIDDDQVLKDVLLDQRTGQNYLLNNEQAQTKFSELGLKNLDALINKIDLHIPFNQKHLIHFPLPTPYQTSSEYLKQLAINGLKQKFQSDLFDPIYITRLKQELQIIHNLGFDDYFLVVQEYVNYAKQHNILVGPGRGSAVGSLVAYALDITTIDPIKYNLLFERFLNPARTSMPDIDIDIEDVKRQALIDHLFAFYNQNNLQRVSYLITFQTIKLKTAIRDVGRVLKIDLSTINKICKLISLKYDESNPEEELKKSLPPNLLEQNQLLFYYALKIVGLFRQYSMHAAGVVLCNENLYDVIPIQIGNNDLIITQYSMDYMEGLGLLKMDLLGLSNLNLISNITNYVKNQLNITLDLNKIPLNDPDVFSDLSHGDTFGVFQFESSGMTSLLKRIIPHCIDDLAMVSAMYRPGPQSQIDDWVKRRKNPDLVSYFIKQLEPILKDTSGLLVYQEQVMQIAVECASFSLADADLLRRAISKKHATELANLQKQFIDGCVSNHISQQDAQTLFKYIFDFASYGFNKSHAIAYAYVSYWLAYLKAHYPVQFLASYLSFKAFKDNQEQILAFANKHQIKLIAPDILNSHFDFYLNIKKNELYFGFNVIKGLGVSYLDKLSELTKIANENLLDIKKCLLLSFKVVNKKVLETLVYAGCYDSLFTKRDELIHLINVIDQFSSFLNTYDLNQQLSLLNAKLEVNSQTAISQDELLNKEVSLLGFSKNDLNKQKNQQNQLVLEDGVNVSVNGCVLLTFIEKQTKKMQPYLSCMFKTSSGQVISNALIPYWKYKKYLAENDFFIKQEKYDVVLCKKGNFINVENIKKIS